MDLERGKTPEHVCTMWKGVWSNEEPSEHHFKNRRKLAALNISVTVLAGLNCIVRMQKGKLFNSRGLEKGAVTQNF